MIVTEFQIDRFRDGQPLRVLDLGNGLNVAFVEDRAAQRMMLDIVPAVLYGQSVFHRGKRGGSSLPATVAVRTDNGVFRIRRTEGTRRDRNGSLSIKSPDGTIHEPSFLRRLVDDVGQRRYERLFTFHSTRCWQEIRQKRERVERDMARLAVGLRDAAPAVEATPLPKVSTKPLHALEGTLTELSTSLADAAKEDLERKKKEAAAIESRNPREIAAEIERVAAEIAAAERHRESVEQDWEETQGALQISRLRMQLEQLDRDLARIQDAAPVTPQTARSKTTRSLEELNVRLARCRQRRVELAEERKGLRAQIASGARESRVRGLLPKIEAALLQEKFLLTEEQAIERLAEHVRELESRLENGRAQSHSRQAEVSHQQTLASQALAELDRYAEQFRRTRREYMELRERLAQIPRTLVPETPLVDSDAAKLLDDMLDDHGEPDSFVSHERAVDSSLSSRDIARERTRIEQQLADLQADRTALDELLQRMYAEQLVPFRVLLWLGVPFMAGVAMIIYGMFMAAADTSWRFVGFGFAFSIATAFVKMSLDHLNGGRLDETRRQVEEIDRDINDLVERGERLAERALQAKSGIPATIKEGDSPRRKERRRKTDVARLAAQGEFGAENDKLTARGPRPNPEWTRLRGQATELRRRYRDMIKRWRDFLLALELSPSLSPSQAKEALEQRVAGSPDTHEGPDRTLEFQLKQLRNDLERRRSAFTQAVSHVRAVAVELGGAATGSTMVEQLNLLRESVQDQQEQTKSQSELRTLLKQVQSRSKRLKEYDRKICHERRQAQSAERRAEQELALRRQMVEEKRKILGRERSEILERMKALRQQLEGRPGALALVDLSPGELDSRRDNLAAQLDVLKQELPSKYEQRGVLLQQKREAEQKGSQRVKGATPWHELIAKADEVAKVWQNATKVADAQVAALRNHQPSTVGPRYLELAADYLRRLTDGRWTSILLDNDSAQIRLRNGQGEEGTLTKLADKELFDAWFALWLAQLDMLADQRVKLPIVLDDPLGMSSHSPLAAAKVLRDFAATGHQLILTTSQPEHAEWFADLEVPIANFALRSATKDSTAKTNENRGTRNGHGGRRSKRAVRKSSGSKRLPESDTTVETWDHTVPSLG